MSDRERGEQSERRQGDRRQAPAPEPPPEGERRRSDRRTPEAPASEG